MENNTASEQNDSNSEDINTDIASSRQPSKGSESLNRHLQVLCRCIWDWIAGRWRWEALAGSSATLLKFGEYGFGWFLMVLAAFAASSKIAHWVPGDGWSKSARIAVKTFGFIFLNVSLTVLLVISVFLKGTDPWSHLPAARDKYIESHWPLQSISLEAVLNRFKQLPPEIAFVHLLPRPRSTSEEHRWTPPGVHKRDNEETELSESYKSDLKMEFVGKERLQYFYFADSPESANEPRRVFGLWDIDHPVFFDSLPNVTQPLQLPSKTEMDFVFRNSRRGPMDVLDTPETKVHVKRGNRLFGVAYVVCLNCKKERSYWVYFEVGKGGWYAEMVEPFWGKAIKVPTSESTYEQLTELLDSQVPPNRRISIPPR